MKPTTQTDKATDNSVIIAVKPDQYTVKEILKSLSYANIRVFSLTKLKASADVRCALLETLHFNSNITSLTLEDCNLQPSNMSIIAQILNTNPNLERLNLSKNSFSPSSIVLLAEPLTKHKHILSLDLSGMGIQDEGVTILAIALQKNQSVTTLNLNATLFGNLGAIALSKAIRNHRGFTYLDFSNNFIEDSGADAIASAIGTYYPLSTLNMYENRITHDGEKNIRSYLRHNPYIKGYREERPKSEMNIRLTLLCLSDDALVRTSKYKQYEIIEFYEALLSNGCDIEKNAKVNAIAKLNRFVNSFILDSLSQIFGNVLLADAQQKNPGMKLTNSGYPYDIITHILSYLTIQDRCLLSVKFSAEDRIIKTRVPTTTKDTFETVMSN